MHHFPFLFYDSCTLTFDKERQSLSDTRVALRRPLLRFYRATVRADALRLPASLRVCRIHKTPPHPLGLPMRPAPLPYDQSSELRVVHGILVD